MVEVAREFRRYSKAPVAIQSNAGLPVTATSGIAYPENPDFLAASAAELLDIGVQIIGGCCGTTPEHIRALRKVVDTRISG